MTVVNSHRNFWDTSPDLQHVKVRDLRGKIKLLCRYTPKPADAGGVDFTGWPENRVADFGKDGAYALQDIYEPENFDQKKRAVEGFLVHQNVSSPPQFRISFASFTYQPLVIEQTAAAMNQSVLNMLQNNPGKSVGVMLFDFVDTENGRKITQNLIERNKFK
jgi:hypothetical protein